MLLMGKWLSLNPILLLVSSLLHELSKAPDLTSRPKSIPSSFASVTKPKNEEGVRRVRKPALHWISNQALAETNYKSCMYSFMSTCPTSQPYEGGIIITTVRATKGAQKERVTRSVSPSPEDVPRSTTFWTQTLTTNLHRLPRF